ncbi:hypothetical protein ckin65_14480 [Helicobacter pylori]
MTKETDIDLIRNYLEKMASLLMEYISEVWIKSEEEFEEFMKDESFENDFIHFMSLLDSKIKVE